MGDKGKRNKTAPKKATKAGKHGLRPRGQPDAAQAGKKAGK